MIPVIGKSSDEEKGTSRKKKEGNNEEIDLSVSRIKHNLIKKFNTELLENLSLIGEINDVLINCSQISDEEKLEFCASQRHFMKKYLKYISFKYGL
ncbi:MAG: hypothetical protein ACFFAS_20080 [Promethearchaeota archaeon]